jgi:ABC-type uncharacterized transport system involved in gliding motility auxiliary subunit
MAQRLPHRAGGTDWVRFSLFVVAAVLLNIASLRFYLRLDLTRAHAYSLSAASTDVVAGLQEPLTIRAYFTRDLPFPYNTLEQQARDLFEEYALESNRHFNYTVTTIDPESETSSEEAAKVRQEAQNYGIYPIQIQKVERDEVKLQSAFLGMVLIHGDMQEAIPALTASQNLEHTVTSAIQKLSSKISALLAVEGKVEVTLYLSGALTRLGGNLGPTFRGLEGELRETVDRLNGKLYGKLAFGVADPDVAPQAAADASRYSLGRLSLSTGATAYASVVLTYGGGFRRVDLVEQGFFGAQVKDPEALSATIEAATEALVGVNPGIGWVAGHAPGQGTQDELSSLLGPQEAPSYANFRTVLSDSYAVEDVDLNEGEIGEGIRTLVIAGPATKFTDWELFRIDQFLMKGNSLAVFVDTHTEIVPQGGNQMQQPVYLPRDTGLEKLLEHWGITVSRSYVLDEDSYVSRQRDASGGIQEVPFYYYPKVQKAGLDQTLPIARNIATIFMLNASPVSKAEGAPADARYHALITSSPTSWEMKENINLRYPWFLQPPAAGDSSRGAKVLAYVAEGKLTSYFADKAVPEPPAPEEGTEGQSSRASISSREIQRTAEVLRETTGARLLVVGTSQILVDAVIDQGGAEPNAVLALNMMDYLSRREGFAELRGKAATVSLLREVKPEVRTYVKTFNVAGLPILVVLGGLGVWLAWASRKKRIRQQFAVRIERGETSEVRG